MIQKRIKKKEMGNVIMKNHMVIRKIRKFDFISKMEKKRKEINNRKMILDI
jgi:hypothetical protein